MVGVSTLLVNAFIIIICILFYQVSWMDRTDEKAHNAILIFLLATVATVLCMTFPFHVSLGYIYDLRLVPIILCFLYGGYRSLFFTSIVYLTYRYYLGGAGFYASILLCLILVFIIFILQYVFPGLIRKRKMVIGMFLIFIACTIFIIFSIFNEIKINNGISDIITQFFISYVVINLFTMWLSLYLIEAMIERKKLKEEMNRSEKMRIIGELAASVAHEIRNPLTVVHGFIQLLGSDKIQESKKEEYLQIMMAELNRAQSIITDYLSLAKSEIGTREQVNMEQLIQQIVTIVSPLALLNGVEIRSSISMTELPYLHTDPEKIKQCLINIIKNGIEAMTNGGVLQVNVHKRSDDFIIDIIDTGIGMTSEEIKQLGMPFYSTKEKGTGLGTMVCYSIIRGLNGKIEVTSQKGKGTCFSIIIPAF